MDDDVHDDAAVSIHAAHALFDDTRWLLVASCYVGVGTSREGGEAPPLVLCSSVASWGQLLLYVFCP
jgi:hypothetical protein